MNSQIVNKDQRSNLAKKAILYGVGVIILMIILQIVTSILLPQFGFEYTMQFNTIRDGRPYTNIAGPMAILFGVAGILLGVLILLSAPLAFLGVTGPAETLINFVDKRFE